MIGAVTAGCLVIDQHMPGMNGLDVVDRLQKEGVRVPTILISGRLDANTKERAANLGVTKRHRQALCRAPSGRTHPDGYVGTQLMPLAAISVAEQHFSLCLRGKLAAPNRTGDSDVSSLSCSKSYRWRSSAGSSTISSRKDPFSVVVTLCAAYAGAVLVQGATKLGLNVYRGWVGENAIRDLRRHVLAYLRIARVVAPGPEVRGVGAAMIVAEVEPIGGFVGSSISEPLLQAGILLSVLAYIVHLDRWMAAAAFAIFMPQLVFVPLMQGR